MPRVSIAQEHDADLNYSREHQDYSKANVYVGESRAAPVENPVEPFTFFAHASLSNRGQVRLNGGRFVVPVDA
jgi:hypothetical protein